MVDTRNTIPRQCHSCGSLVTLEAKPFRDEVALAWRCTGCRSSGARYYKDLPLKEARRLASEQTALASVRSARIEAECWEERVAEWVASDAAVFLMLVRKRFPQWREYLTYEAVEYLGGSQQLTIPSANPQVEVPLSVCVGVNEVLIGWVDAWHEHIWREYDQGQDDKSHLSLACDEIENLVEERIRTGTVYVDGQLSCGRTLRSGQAFPDDWKQRRHPWRDGARVSIVARSWRGTYDEEWHSDGAGEGPQTQAT